MIHLQSRSSTECSRTSSRRSNINILWNRETLRNQRKWAHAGNQRKNIKKTKSTRKKRRTRLSRISSVETSTTWLEVKLKILSKLKTKTYFKRPSKTMPELSSKMKG